MASGISLQEACVKKSMEEARKIKDLALHESGARAAKAAKAC